MAWASVSRLEAKNYSEIRRPCAPLVPSTSPRRYHWERQQEDGVFVVPVLSFVPRLSGYYGLLEGRTLKFSRVAAVLTDVHFWLPVIVLILGISLLIVLAASLLTVRG